MKHTEHNDNSFMGLVHTFSGTQEEGLRLMAFLVEHGMGFKYLPTLPGRVVVTDINDGCYQELLRIKKEGKQHQSH